MAKFFPSILPIHQTFIENQKLFFVATAAADGRINLSPKGLDTFCIIDENTVLWLNLTGSGNETAAHLLENNRMTIMFCSFEGKPNIIRLYGHATAIHSNDSKWDKLVSKFPSNIGARQIMEMKVKSLQTSCGYAVPFYEFKGDRSILNDWSNKKGKEGIENYWAERNTESIDGKPTGIE